MRRMLRYARWDTDAVRDDLRAYTAPPPVPGTGTTSPQQRLRDPTTKIKTYSCRDGPPARL